MHFVPEGRDGEVSQFRKLEKLSIKSTKLQMDINYFENCLYLEISPTYLHFKPPNLQAYSVDNLKQLYKKVIKNQLGILRKELKQISSQLGCLKETIGNKLSLMENSVLLAKIHKVVNQVSVDTARRHKRKLLLLW